MNVLLTNDSDFILAVMEFCTSKRKLDGRKKILFINILFTLINLKSTRKY